MSTRASGGTADALASGASVRKGVGVQIPPRARGTVRLTSRMCSENYASWALILIGMRAQLCFSGASRCDCGCLVRPTHAVSQVRCHLSVQQSPTPPPSTTPWPRCQRASVLNRLTVRFPGRPSFALVFAAASIVFGLAFVTPAPAVVSQGGAVATELTSFGADLAHVGGVCHTVGLAAGLAPASAIAVAVRGSVSRVIWRQGHAVHPKAPISR